MTNYFTASNKDANQHDAQSSPAMQCESTINTVPTINAVNGCQIPQKSDAIEPDKSWIGPISPAMFLKMSLLNLYHIKTTLETNNNEYYNK